MLLLADENVPGDLVNAMRQAGHDVAWVLTDNPSSPDPAVLARAQAEHRILLTFDKDFGELAFHALLAAESGVVLCRLAALSSAEMVATVMAAIGSRSDWPGHFSVIEETQIRMTPLPE